MLLNTYNNGIVHGMQLSTKNMLLGPCKGCTHGKNTCKSFPMQRSCPQAKKAGEFFHTDIYGPISVASYGGAKYFVIFKDNCIGFRIIYCIRSKLEVFEKFKELQALVQCNIENTIIRIWSH